jgi:hypothetical protein
LAANPSNPTAAAETATAAAETATAAAETKTAAAETKTAAAETAATSDGVDRSEIERNANGSEEPSSTDPELWNIDGGCNHSAAAPAGPLEVTVPADDAPVPPVFFPVDSDSNSDAKPPLKISEDRVVASGRGLVRIGQWITPTATASVKLKRYGGRQNFSCIPVIGLMRKTDNQWLYAYEVDFDSEPEFYGRLKRGAFLQRKKAKDSKAKGSEEGGEESSNEEDDEDEVQVDGNIDIDWESIKMELRNGKLSYFLDSTQAAAATMPVVLNTDTERSSKTCFSSLCHSRSSRIGALTNNGQSLTLSEVEEIGEVAFAAKLKTNKRFCPKGQNLRALMLNGKEFPQEEESSE